ncbi:transaldolase [Microdochium bolleyi]|uniref:Transaldolase n=1 Tax=Microdochium bolleyi TaxID=196109 RepID=A0A136IPM6_9PEZI|nr:transaldolase [Microdochium bolleyi]
MAGDRPHTLLDKLRSLGQVDCDTFDVEVARELGPFVDCTSNQAIAYHELIRPSGITATTTSDEGKEPRLLHEQLIADSASLASSLTGPEFDGVDKPELAVEVMMVKLALRIVPFLSGYSHVETNPRHAYDVEKTVRNARRIIAIFKALDPSYDAQNRVCIKIPATWEGMQACRELESSTPRIATLATTMFCKEQALLAANVGCTYIAPYINELRVHFDPGFVDEAKAFTFSATAQAYFDAHRPAIKTQVLPASLTSIQEVMMLAGSHHITVSPPLLQKLAETPADPWADIGLTGSAFTAAEVAEGARTWGGAEDEQVVRDEAAWKKAFGESMGGRAEAKIVQAIRIFTEKQDGLEGIACDALGRQ